MGAKPLSIVQWLLLAFLILAPTVIVLVYKKPSLAYPVILAGAAALILIRPELSSFGLLGMKATLERQIGQVQVTIEELRKMAAATAKANLTQLAMSGQLMHGINTDVKFGIRDRIIASLKEIGVLKDDIHDSQEIWISVYCDMLLGDIEEEATKLSPGATEEIEKLPTYRGFGVPDPETLEKWIKSKLLKSDRLNQLLDEYKRLWTTGGMKDPSIIPFNRVMRMKGN
jgi:hypothetical protein